MNIVVDKDPRGNFGPTRDQDPRPTCMAFAASDAHAGVRAGWRALSVEWAYYCALKRDRGVPHDGATMGGMLAALRLDGQPDEEAWPYIAELFTDVTAWVPPKANPVFRRESTPLAATIETLITRIDADEPVLFTMSVSPAFFDRTAMASSRLPRLYSPCESTLWSLSAMVTALGIALCLSVTLGARRGGSMATLGSRQAISNHGCRALLQWLENCSPCIFR
jgi:hypothetical protein